MCLLLLSMKGDKNTESPSKYQDQTNSCLNTTQTSKSKEKSSSTFEENIKQSLNSAVTSCASKLEKFNKSPNKKPWKSKPPSIPCSEDNSEQLSSPIKSPPEPKKQIPVHNGIKKTVTFSLPSSASMTPAQPLIFNYLPKWSNSTST